MTILPNVPSPSKTHLPDAEKVEFLLNLLEGVNHDLLRQIPKRGNGYLECLAGAINDNLMAFGRQPIPSP